MLRRVIPFALLSLLATCFATCFATTVLAQAPSTGPADGSLRVLLVGNDPKAPDIMFADSAKPRTVALHGERTAAFEALLRYHFQHVTVVYGNDYTVDMSDQVDVTIFDTRPKKLTEAVREKDPKTGETNYEPATYLPESFDRPALMISANAPQIGEPLGLKLDWL